MKHTKPVKPGILILRTLKKRGIDKLQAIELLAERLKCGGKYAAKQFGSKKPWSNPVLCSMAAISDYGLMRLQAACAEYFAANPYDNDSTSDLQIKAALHQLFLQSVERRRALSAAGHRCELCGVKASKAQGKKVSLQVHHRSGAVNWQALFAAVRAELLCNPAALQALCRGCHDAKHGRSKKK
jgi:5-methylcytosine-specific restriction endonuclease McrA